MATTLAGVLSEQQRRALAAVCDTVAPALASDAEDELVRAFLARSASDLEVPAQIEGLMGAALMPEEIAGFADLLDALAGSGFEAMTLEERTGAIHAVAASSPEAKLRVKALRQLTFLLFYALPDADGRNPNWPAIRYPGPLSAPPSPDRAPKTIRVERISGAEARLTADVCVVGSGAGGAVIAAELQRAGRSVVVLEQGGYRNEADFKQLELPGLFELYLRGGLMSSEDGSVALLAGATLGGGTVVNYMHCFRPLDSVRAEWAAHGLAGLDQPEYERHIDAVWERLGVNDVATAQNAVHRRLIEGLGALGIPHSTIHRNADPGCDDPSVCGYCYAGCQKGCKRSTLRTYLQDAADLGARFVIGCRAERILLKDGRAAGVAASVTGADGSLTRLVVEAPTVVVACGGIESPALLLRSRVGGPAVGKHLHLHPATVVEGFYDEPIDGWSGQIQSALSDAFAELEGEWGFLIEALGTAPALHLLNLPWQDGRQHKELALRVRHMAPFLTLQRDHGEGEVVLDQHDRALVRWSLTDEIDRRVLLAGIAELARVHRAAGATEILTLHAHPVRWRAGQDFDAFLRQVAEASLAPNDITLFSAHHMGSCRMGSDPATSVADGRGELHDVDGVWIGDASAFPTPSGGHPMIAIMALAHRTAAQILSPHRAT